MTGQPSRDNGRPDDAADEALVRRVAAAQEARLGRPVPTDLDPVTVRRGLVGDRDAMMIAVATLHRAGAGAAVPDALDAALAGKPPAAAFDVPPGVATAIVARTPVRHAPAVFAALDAELERFAARVAEKPQAVREFAHLTVHSITDATRAGIVASITAEVVAAWAGQIDRSTGQPFSREQMVQAAEGTADTVAIPAILDRCRADLSALSGLPVAVPAYDRDHENRCRRAAVLNALAQLRGDADMQEHAVRLALLVCSDRPDLRPSDVFRAGAPVLMLPADAGPADVDAALVAELAAIAAAEADDGAT